MISLFYIYMYILMFLSSNIKFPCALYYYTLLSDRFMSVSNIGRIDL